MRHSNTEALVEMQQYLRVKNLPRSEDPIKWWKDNAASYPLLKKLAQKYLIIPGTSVPAERLFSKAGELVSAKRSSLKPENIDMFLFLNKNL